MLTEKQKAIAKICASITGQPCTHYGQKPLDGVLGSIFDDAMADILRRLRNTNESK